MFRLRCVAFATVVVAVAVAVSLSVPANVGATNVLTVGLPAERVGNQDWRGDPWHGFG
jgi:hypothetical protein